LILLGGCAQNSLKVPKATTAMDYPSEELRRSFGKIAVVPIYAAPEISLNDSVYDKGQCAKEMAGSAVVGMLDGCTGGMGCLGLLLLSPVVAGVGAIAGAAEADTEEQVKARIEIIHARTETSDIARRFQEKGEEVATQYEEFSSMIVPVTRSADLSEIQFGQMRQQKIDTVLQLGISDISSHAAEDVYCDPALALNIQTRLKLFSIDGKPVYSTSISRTSKARELEDWAQRDAQNWDDALHEFIDDVTIRLLEDVFLHIAPPAQILQVPTPSYAKGSRETLVEKRPTFAWTWGPTDANGWRHDLVPPDSEITYDLRVLDAYSGYIQYEKYGLQKTEHKLEKKLRKKNNYNWQVRATFSWDGKIRRTQWLGNFPATVRR
jgi:hypothetical protein